MTKDERIRAFALRCDGRSWEYIASVLHYDPKTVARNLHAALRQPTRPPAIRYPAIRAHVEQHYRSSIESFARSMGVSPYRLRRVIIHGDPPSASLMAKLIQITGIEREELFQCTEARRD